MTPTSMTADDPLWRSGVLPCLPVCELVAARATDRSHAAVITADLLLQRIDALLSRHGLTGLIDIDRTTPSLNQLGGLIGVILGCLQRLRAYTRRLTGRRLTRLGYLVRCLYVLEQGGSEWRVMGMAVRLAAICRLTPNGLPLVLSVAHLHSRAAFDSVPLTVAIYQLLSHQLTCNGYSLTLQPLKNRLYAIGTRSFRRVLLRVVPLGDLPVNHRFAEGYQQSDPVVRWGPWVYLSFSAFLLDTLGMRHWISLRAPMTVQDSVYRSLLDGDIPEQHRADITRRCLRVYVSGLQPEDSAAGRLWVAKALIHLYTTEIPAAAAPAPLSVRFPVSMPMWRHVLGHFDIESGRVLV
ncbi:unnamed protein product [Vitrella brassicaformis CCMP3155]|uniref:Uncharacterized protein n=1 Tax=Vitrella brassicaformis (strain CCMP3155) TaxID=1169540 RepID=A0A0G4ENA7_VITBC|nr:unnamed protein product [Vitrella brassicaformis CCMP3155]|eukprot:CEL98611.1 unnamed protein product [Vitrella brassicaformis CCMP3155]